MKKLIKNVTAVSGDGSELADILIEGEKIAKIQKNISDSEAEIIDGTGLLAFPGFIDGHTHFDLHVAGTVTADDFESGTLSAVCGGTTTIIDYGTAYQNETLNEGADNWLDKAKNGVSCDYSIHQTITKWDENIEKECEDMIKRGITTFKIYMTYDIQIDDHDVYLALKRLKELGAFTGCHCENAGMIDAIREEYAKDERIEKVSSHYLTRPDVAEAEAVNRLLYMAGKLDAPVMVVHTTCEKALDEIRAARKRGQIVLAETCPQYLIFTDDVYEKPGFEGAAYVCAPPIRKEADKDALWQAIARGEIDTIATDHCSFTLEQKKLGKGDFRAIPGGVPGVYNRGRLIYSEGVAKNRITKEDMARVLSERAADIYGLSHKKGRLKEGLDADIVLIDPNEKDVISAENDPSKAGYTPYEGIELQGKIKKVFLRGNLVSAEGKPVLEKTGEFIKRKLPKFF